MSGLPQTCGCSERTWVLPAAMSATASARGAVRSVWFALPNSRLRLANPALPSGRPTLPANWYASPSPAPCMPVLTSNDPPEAASLSWKFITPAIASEPYCAAAPSRSTSTWRSAMAGITEMSGPWEPYATPLPPCHSSTEERWRRLPLMSTSVWSGARLRSMAGRTTVEAPWIGWVLELNDGMTVRSCSFRSPAPRRRRSVDDRTSTGTADSVALRGAAREPTTTVSSLKPASRLSISAGDRPSAATSSGVIPSAWPSCSISSAAGRPACCAAFSCGAPNAASASASHAGASSASARATRRCARCRVLMYIV